MSYWHLNPNELFCLNRSVTRNTDGPLCDWPHNTRKYTSLGVGPGALLGRWTTAGPGEGEREGANQEQINRTARQSITGRRIFRF